MEKILVIPDIHHKVGRVAEILHKETPDRVIFLGDWFDDFYDTLRNCRDTALWLSNRIDNYPEDIFLWGNHDLAYGFPSRETYCSGFATDKHIAIKDVMSSSHWDRFKFTHWEGDWLFSHGGLTAPHVNGIMNDGLKYWLEGEERDAQLRVRSGKPHWMYQPGMSRGGRAVFGGVTWCDVSEFLPIDGVNQVFGHTPQHRPWKYDIKRRKGKKITGENYCIDTHLQHYGLIEGNVFWIDSVLNLQM